MDEFEHINHRISDLFEDKLDNRDNFQLRSFHNNYRYDPSLDETRTHWRVEDRSFINMLFLKDYGTTCNTCGKTTRSNLCDVNCMHSYAFQHSWEPIDTVLDYNFWDIQQQILDRISNWSLYVLHSEKSTEINKLLDRGFKPIHWFANGYLCANHWYKLYKDINIVTEYLPLQHKFVCANRLIDDQRSYRIKFLNMINVSQGQYSLLENDPNTGRTPWEIYPDNLVEPRSFDEHDNSSAWINLHIDDSDKKIFTPTIWKTSFLHVVAETVVDRVHLTEKIFKPIVLKQPFVLLNGAGGLEYLRSYGFKTFSDFWSEEYDTIDDLDQRLKAVSYIVNGVGSVSLDHLEKMRDKMKPVLEHNYNWFYNGFADKCWSELETNMQTVFGNPAS